MGRAIQSKIPSHIEGQYVVSGHVEYNDRGLPEKQYVSSFVTTPITSIDPINTSLPHTTVTYDSMGRAILSTNPDGTYSSVEYTDWTTTTTDANGHMQKSYFDAYGRLIIKEEYLGADGRSPQYAYQPYALYAATQYTYDSETSNSTSA